MGIWGAGGSPFSEWADQGLGDSIWDLPSTFLTAVFLIVTREGFGLLIRQIFFF